MQIPQSLCRSRSLSSNTRAAGILYRLQVIHDACRPLGLFSNLTSHLLMQNLHQALQRARFAPAACSANRRPVGGQVFQQVSPIIAILKVTENAIDNPR